jgi:glycerol-3-phosphate dehydrogenase
MWIGRRLLHVHLIGLNKTKEAMNRKQVLQQLREKSWQSVLIVGGGINGVGTFRDLALNGVDVLLIDRADFCSGASAASSHMAHGGIRYLENGEFRLVREAVAERNRMIQNAPHLVRPLPTTIPIFKLCGTSYPGGQNAHFSNRDFMTSYGVLPL